MAVRSFSLALVSGVPFGGFRTLYTVPAGRTVILKEYGVLNLTGAPVTVVVRVRREGVLVGLALGTDLPHGQALTAVQRDLVLNPGDALEVRCVTTGSGDAGLHVTASGSLLAGVAA